MRLEMRMEHAFLEARNHDADIGRRRVYTRALSNFVASQPSSH